MSAPAVIPPIDIGTAPPVEAFTRRRPWRWLPRTPVGWLIALAVAVLFVVTMLRMFSIEDGPLLAVVGLTPFYALAAFVVLAISWLSRSWLVVGIAFLCAGLLGAWTLPLYVPDGKEAAGPSLTIMTANMYDGDGSASNVLRIAQENNVDLLALQEVTPQLAEDLRNAGIKDVFPYSRGESSPNPTNVVWSKYPVKKVKSLDDSSAPLNGARIDVAGRKFTFVSAHPISPDARGHQNWAADHDLVRTQLLELSGGVIVAGDFNATLDHSVLRRLQLDGFMPAERESGSGVIRTWPSDKGLFPLYGIDHVLAKNTDAVASGVASYEVKGSDHRAVIARYRFLT